MGTISYQLLICSKLTLCFDVGDIKHSEFSTQRDSHMVERRAFSLSTLYMDAQLHQWEKQCLKKCSPTCLPDQGLGNLLHVNPQSTTMGESEWWCGRCIWFGVHHLCLFMFGYLQDICKKHNLSSCTIIFVVCNIYVCDLQTYLVKKRTNKQTKNPIISKLMALVNEHTDYKSFVRYCILKEMRER